MTLESTTNIAGPFTCNGSTKDFPFTFSALSADHIVVTKKLVATGVVTLLAETTNYVLSGADTDGRYPTGGTVSTVSGGLPYAYASGYELTITRTVPLTQPSDFTEGMRTLYQNFEDGLDRITMQVQQQSNATYGTAFLVEHNVNGTHKVATPPATVVYPESYGAVGNGTTDDTVAIQAAINVLAAGRGGVVELSNKTYKITAKLSITTGYIGLRGQEGWTGQYGSTIHATFTNDTIIEVKGASSGSRILHNFIEGIVIERPALASSTGAGVYAQHTVRFRMKDVTVAESNAGVQFNDCIDPLLDHVLAGRTVDFSIASFGFYLDGSSGNASVKLRDCMAFWPVTPHTAACYGLLSQGTSIGDIWIDTLNAGNSDYGIALVATGPIYYDIQIRNPIIDQFGVVGMYLEGFGIDGSATITGGWTAPSSTGVVSYGIQVYNCKGVHIIGHQAYGQGNKANHTGILLNGTSTNNSLIGNNIKQCGIGIILDTGADYNEVIGNIIPAASNTATITDSGTGNDVAHNMTS